jgi:predicted AAA+ superfamily ATPase
VGVGGEKLVCAAYRVCKARARLPRVLASWSGKPFNTAALGRQLGVSRPTVVKYIGALERAGLVRLLPFYGGGRRPLLLLSSSPPGAWAEQLIARLLQIKPESRFFWWKTGRTRVVDLIADVGTEKIGFRFLLSKLPRRRDWLALDIASWRDVIRRGFLLYTGTRDFVVASVIHVLPVNSFMSELEEWILRRQTKPRIKYRYLARPRRLL